MTTGGSMGKNSFIRGAFMLAAASLGAKVIGALFKIPLGNLLGGDGMGVFTIAYNIYTALFVVSTAGLAVAISKMVSEANALGRQDESRRIFYTALTAFSLLGLAFWIILWLEADAFAGLVGSSGAAAAVRAAAPSLFLVSVMSVIRGYYQGLSDMAPTAVSQILEALGKLIVGYGAAWLLLQAGYGLETAAAGAILGVTAGSLLGTLYLLFCLRRRGLAGGSVANFLRPSRPTASWRAILRRVFSISIPVMAGASALSLTNLIDMALVINRLRDIGFSQQAANSLYGSYNMVGALFNLPQTVVAALSISVIPVVSGYYSRRNLEKTRRTTSSALRIAALVSMPAGVGFWLLSEPILQLIYFARPQDSAAGAPLLSLLGLAVFFVALVSMTNSILQAMGLARVPVYTMLVGGLVKLLVSYILVGEPTVNIAGAPIGTACCYAAIALLNLGAIRRAGVPISYVRVFARPALAAGLMGVFASLFHAPAAWLFGPKIGVVLTVVLCVLFYGLMLAAVRALPKEDVLLLPRGERIAKLLRM